MYPRIRDLRQDADKSQQELANYLNVHQTTYSDYELGKLDIPTGILIKLADYYATSVDYLLGRTNDRR